MRVFADIDKNPVELARLIKENRGAVVSYKTLSVYKALSALQSVAAYLNIKDEAYTIVRLLALKAAAGITHLVVDIPVGPKTLIKTSQQAIHARKLIEYAGDVLGLKTDVVMRLVTSDVFCAIKITRRKGYLKKPCFWRGVCLSLIRP